MANNKLLYYFLFVHACKILLLSLTFANLPVSVHYLNRKTASTFARTQPPI